MTTLRRGHHYGQPLTVAMERGALVIRIGAQTLAHATSYAEWANEWDDAKDDYIRTFAIEDPIELAKDVGHAMLHEQEDGSSPLSDFIDAMTQAAIEDGSLAIADIDDVAIPHGQHHSVETWASEAASARPAREET